ncbi:MAG TPA: M20/M25/M40 family metallo-hydrolase [Conexibacter sp.]|nr:M20/M25/M40 family metallo-hydrolase [Conexibacter sp.]
MSATEPAAVAQRVRAWIEQREEQIVATLRELVRVPSVAGTIEQNAALDVVRAHLADGVEVDDWVPDWDAVSRLEAPIGRRMWVPVGEERGAEHVAVLDRERCLVASVGAGGPHLVLNGHIDVVPATAAEWSEAPFGAAHADGRVVGRGTYDMKGGVVAALYAFNAIAELGLLERGRLSLAVVPEEESGGNGTLACIARGHVGDGAIFAEPTHLQVLHRHVGIQSFVLEAHGREGLMLKHGAGASAIDALAHALVALEETAARRRERALAGGGYADDDDPAFVNAGIVGGGEWPATRARSARASGLFGVLPGETLEQAERELRDAVAEATRGREGSGAEIRFGRGGHPGGELPADHPLVRALAGAGADLALPVEPSRAGAMVCDAKVLHGGGWAPAVVFGPAGGNAHAADEWVDVGSVVQAAQVLATAAVRYCAGDA